MTRAVRAHVASAFGPACRSAVVPLRASVAEAAALVRVGPGSLAFVGGAFVPAAQWGRVRLKADVVFTAAPRGGNTFRTIALIAAAAAISVAAPGVGTAFAAGLGFAATSTAALIGSVAFTAVAGIATNLAINALFPPARPSAANQPGRLASLTSARNQARPGRRFPSSSGGCARRRTWRRRGGPSFAAPTSSCRRRSATGSGRSLSRT